MDKALKLSFTAIVRKQDAQPREFRVVGRDAWCLLHLIYAGSKGVTPLERPAPRWSHYIKQLRDLGLGIETHYERHDGGFAGNHGRYELKDEVEVAGGTLAEWLSSAAGRREFNYPARFLRVAA